MNSAAGIRLKVDRPILMLVTEPHPDLPDIVRAAVDGGVDIAQWRDKTGYPAEVAGMRKPMREATTGGALLVINLGPERSCAFRFGFGEQEDGIHFPEGTDGNPILWWTLEDGCRKIESPHSDPKCGITGESIHSVDSALRTEQAGADYVVAGTIFESTSHPGAPAAGLGFLADVCRAVSIPVIAIGGITPERVAGCLQAGAAGIAVLSPIMRAADPRAAAVAYRQALDAG